MRIKLTDTKIEKLKAPDPSGKQKLHWDEDLKGFGVLCSGKTNAKTYVVQKDLPNGRTRRLTVAAVNEVGLEQAREVAEDMLFKLRQGLDPKAKRPTDWTLRDTLNHYLADNSNLRPASIKSYRRSIEQYLTSWADQPLRTITRDMVEKRHKELGATATRLGTGGYATANITMRTLRVLWNYAADDRIADLPKNPVRLKKQWFNLQPKDRRVKSEDLPKFYAAVMDLPSAIARDYLLLLLFTGFRRTEAASLRWDDLDFTDRTIRVPGKRTKSGQKLDLPMTDLVHDLLVRRGAVGREQYVFPSDSKAGYIAEPRFPLQQVAVTTGIQIAPHDLRRTFIDVAEGTPNISAYALKALVNHALGNDVTAGYMAMTAERLREPAQLVADRFKALCGIEPAGH